MKHSTRRLRQQAIGCLLTPLFCLATAAAWGSPEVPGADQKRPIAIVGATIHPVSGPAIRGGTLVFGAGRIAAVGRGAPVPHEAERIDGRNLHVYPGYIDAGSNIGLTEISSVRATRDSRETGSINPNVKAEVAVNPDSELIPVARANGVLLGLSAPSGGLISGTSAVLLLDGWTWEDMTLKAPVGMHVNWPRLGSPERQSGDTPLDRLQKLFDEARAYHKARQADPQAHPVDLRWEAMLPVLQGKIPLIVSADGVSQIRSAVAFAARGQLRLILRGGHDAPHCAALLKQRQIPVILSGVYRLPRRRDEPYDTAYTLPERLRAAGVKFCIAAGGNATGLRNLPYHAAMAAAFGLPRDEALKAITLYPAQILGVADRVGSLEVGKDATLIVTDGDPLETPTQVQTAFIQGRRVQLTSRHTRLWSKYREKYRRARQAKGS